MPWFARLCRLARRSPRRRAQALFGQIEARARAPVFYTKYAVADSPDGRFDLLALHLWLVHARLKADAPRTAQALVDAAFSRFEAAVREQAGGDGALVRALKRFAEAVSGRFAAYDGAGDAGLAPAILRNLYRTEVAAASPALQSCAQAMSGYVRAARARLADRPADAPLDFGPLPG